MARDTFYSWVVFAGRDWLAGEEGYARKREAIRDARERARRWARDLGHEVRWHVVDHSRDVDPHCADGPCSAPLVAQGREEP